MVADEVRYLGERAAELLAAYQNTELPAPLTTFGQTEALWQEVVWPELLKFCSMQNNWGAVASPPEDSRWYANWRVPELGGGPSR